MKLPQPCPKCEASIFNYTLTCGRCGYSRLQTFNAKEIGFTLRQKPRPVEAPKPSKIHYFD